MQVTTSKRKATLTTLLSSQDTELSATCKLSNKIKHATYRKFNLRQNKSSRKTKSLQLNRAAAKKRKKQLTAKRNKHANPMRSSSSSGACFSPTQKIKLGSQQRKQKNLEK